MRLVIVGTMGIMPQDAYYYFYSEHLALSYFDHPPGVAVHLWLFTQILGDQVWSLKLADFLLTCGTLVVFYFLARRFLSSLWSRRALLVYGTTLMVTDVSVVTTPDVPLLLLWAAALLLAHMAITSDRVWLWAVAGLLAGLAFDAKYTALYLPVALVGFLMLRSDTRRLLFSWRPLLYILMFIVAALPVVIWNAQNDLASFQFQSGDRVSSMLELNLRPTYFLGTVGHQLAMVLPVLFIAIVVLSWKYLRKGLRQQSLHRDTLFLLCFGAPLILGFFAISWIYWVKINWMLPAYLSLTILAVRFLSTSQLKWQVYAALFVHVLLMIQIVWYPVHIQSDDTYWGWPQLTGEVKYLTDKHPDHFVFSRDGYKTTAVLNFFLDEEIYAANVIGENALQYSIADHDLTHLKGKDALFLDSRNMPRTFDEPYVPPPEILPWFEEVRPVTMIELKNQRGNTLRQFAVVECLNYQPVRDREEANRSN